MTPPMAEAMKQARDGSLGAISSERSADSPRNHMPPAPIATARLSRAAK
jgi:hypothetical protein